MSEIRVSRQAQLGLLLSIIAAVAAVTALQLPELQRYMKIRSM